MEKIRYLSASERINYGDLLFPIIFKHYFEKKYQIEYYGLVKSNNLEFGALPTKSFRDLKNDIDSKNDVIIIGGGKVLLVSWNTLFSYISKTFNRFTKLPIFKSIIARTNLASIILSGKNTYSPYAPDLGAPLIYIGAGGSIPKFSENKKIKQVYNAFKTSSSISVRDKSTFDNLRKNSIDSKLIPDSALLMSKIFSVKYLISKTKLEFDAINTNYIFLQVGINNGPKDLKKFVQSLEELSAKQGMKVVCCPIGLAAGHEDDKMLKLLQGMSKNLEYIEPSNLYEIMYLISQSNVYMGTSLHGAITAFAYNVPILPLSENVKKLSDYIKTWMSDIYIHTVDFYNINEEYDRAIKKWDKELSKKLLHDQQDLIEEHFNYIDEIIKKI